MKKIFCLILILILIGVVSCGNYNANHTGPNGEIRSTSEAMFQREVRFYNVYHEGEWHEFIVNAGFNAGGLDHWPGCKFCKEKKEKEKKAKASK